MKKNNHYIILRSLQRSGTHAISMWLEQDKNVRFYNNISASNGRINSINSCISLKKNTSLIKDKLKKKSTYIDVYGIELQNIWYDLNVKTNATQHNILLLRSPFNWISSFLKLKEGTILKSKNEKYMFMQMWKTYAHEFIGKTNYLKNKLNIYYDAWVSDKKYRKKLYSKLENLGCNFNYKNINFISNAGNGSSFTGTEVSGKQLSSEVLNRYDFLDQDQQEIVKLIMQDDEIKYLKEEIKKHI